MNLIVAIDEKNGIGLKGNLLYKLPDDLKYFKQMTLGKVVIMGHSTLKALPGAKPLPGRTNIVLTRNQDIDAEGVIVCHTLAALFQTIAPYSSDDVFVIGGAAVYAQLLEYCHKAYITKVQCAVPADKFFPDIDNDDNWVLLSESDVKENHGIRFTYCVYENNAVVKWPEASSAPEASLNQGS